MFSNGTPDPTTKITSAYDNRSELFPRERVISVVAGVLYLLVFRSVYYSYISVEWGYTGLIYREISFLELAFIYIMVGLVSWFIPTKLEKPSTIILWFFFVIVFVPAIAITFMIGLLPPEQYMPALGAFSMGLIAISLLVAKGRYPDRVPVASFPPAMCNALLASFLISSLAIFYVFGDIMQFASIDDVYVQRFAAADFSSGIMGYIRAYHSYLFTPLIMAIGLCDRKRRPFIAFGFVGFLLSYMVDASKISLVIPFIMLASALIFKLQWVRTYHMTGGLIVLCVVSAALTGSVRIVRFLADLVLLRTIAIPGQTFAQYFDVFSVKGYTWWSNVTGVSSIVPPPGAFQQDRFWPVLGQIVGAEYYGSESRVNLNANPFVGEGVAAAGPVGVLLISLAIAVFLRTIDRASALWNLRVLLVLAVPIGLMLTNVHLTTYLVSFGGIAWILLFRFAPPETNFIQRGNAASTDKWVLPLGKGG